MHDYETAAVKAAQILIQHDIRTAPVAVVPILKAIKGVFVVSFTEMADQSGLDRNNLVTMFGAENQDAITFIKELGGMPHYFVAYNQRLPYYLIQRSLARELGHIVLGHDLSKPADERTIESLYFARHLLCPRPMIRAIQESGVPLTVEIVGNITGCYGRSIAGIRQTPGAHVPAELNRQVREQFADYIQNFLAYESIMADDDESVLADFGTYMDNYIE